MMRNILYVIFSACLILSCGDGNKMGSKKSSLEKGQIYLADADKLRNSGNDKEAKKYYKKAVLEFEEEVRRNPEQAGLARMLGQAQYRIRDFDNAIQWLKKAKGVDKTDAVSEQYLGFCLVNKTKIMEAEQAFRSAFFIDKTEEFKNTTIKELTDIGELSLNLGDNFIAQGNGGQGVEFKKLGMRIMAMALEYSKYDMILAKEIQKYANEMNDQILKDWISNVIENDGKTTRTIELNK